MTRMLRYLLLSLLLTSLLVTGCTTKVRTRQPRVVPPPPSLPQPPLLPPLSTPSISPSNLTELPDWGKQTFAASWPALLQSCHSLAKRQEWARICQDASHLVPYDNVALRHFFETRFTAWQMTNGTHDSGLITGYYEPLLKGSLTQSARTPWPVYGVPQDLITLEVPFAFRNEPSLVARHVSPNRLVVVRAATVPRVGEVVVRMADFAVADRAVLKGRIENTHFLPYYTRADMARSARINTAAVLAWVEDPVALFFLQIQGSGRIQLEDGSFLRVGYGDNNGHGYQSIGRWLIDKESVAPAHASMQGIQRWLKANPQRQQELFNINPRYTFFKIMPQTDGGPIGTLGVPLTDGYSIAVDPRYIPLGGPVYLSTTWPASVQPLNRLVYAQDTGSAILGAVRADFFWGFGEQAAMYAGKMKQLGRLWVLLPHGITPDNLTTIEAFGRQANVTN